MPLARIGDDLLDWNESSPVIVRSTPGARSRSRCALVYGQSITDGCIDWATTETVLHRLAGVVEWPVGTPRLDGKPAGRRLIWHGQGRAAIPVSARDHAALSPSQAVNTETAKSSSPAARPARMVARGLAIKRLRLRYMRSVRLMLLFIGTTQTP